MKRILLLSICVSFFFVYPVFSDNQLMEYHEKDIRLSKTTAEKLKPRSLFIPPISARLIGDSQISVTFKTDMNVSIAITSNDTGSIVYTNNITATPSTELIINLEDLEEGSYEITFACDDTLLTGEFVL